MVWFALSALFGLDARRNVAYPYKHHYRTDIYLCFLAFDDPCIYFEVRMSGFICMWSGSVLLAIIIENNECIGAW